MAKNKERIATAQVVALATGAIAELSTAQVAALSSNDIAAIGTADISGLKTNVIAGLSTAQLTALTTDQIGALDAVDLPVQTSTQIDAPKLATVRPTFALLKNHGLNSDGRTSEFFAAGTEFDAEKDAHTIARLAQSGAQLEEK